MSRVEDIKKWREWQSKSDHSMRPVLPDELAIVERRLTEISDTLAIIADALSNNNKEEDEFEQCEKSLADLMYNPSELFSPNVDKTESLTKENEVHNQVSDDIANQRGIEMNYAGYSVHDAETWHRCPYCGKSYGGWSFVNGSIKCVNGKFKCKCGAILNKPR